MSSSTLGSGSEAFSPLDVDVHDVWLGCLGLGGNWPQELVEFALIVDGPAGSGEYLVLIQAINEVLMDGDSTRRASRHLTAV